MTTKMPATYFFPIPAQPGGSNSWGFTMSIGGATTINDSTNATGQTVIDYSEIRDAVLDVPDEEAISNILRLFNERQPAIPQEVLSLARDPLRQWLQTADFHG